MIWEILFGLSTTIGLLETKINLEEWNDGIIIILMITMTSAFEILMKRTTNQSIDVFVSIPNVLLSILFYFYFRHLKSQKIMKLLLGKHIFVSTGARFELSKNLVYPRKWKIPRFCHLFIFRETDSSRVATNNSNYSVFE